MANLLSTNDLLAAGIGFTVPADIVKLEIPQRFLFQTREELRTLNFRNTMASTCSLHGLVANNFRQSQVTSNALTDTFQTVALAVL